MKPTSSSGGASNPNGGWSSGPSSVAIASMVSLPAPGKHVSGPGASRRAVAVTAPGGSASSSCPGCEPYPLFQKGVHASAGRAASAVSAISADAMIMTATRMTFILARRRRSRA